MGNPTFTHLQGAASSVGTLNVSMNFAGEGGALLVAVCSEETSAGSISGISDNKGNVWQAAAPAQTNGTHISQVFYCAGCSGSAGNTVVTFTVSGTPSGNGQIAVDQYGVDTVNLVSGAGFVLEAYSQAIQATPGPSIGTFASLTSLLVVTADGASIASYTAGSGFTLGNGGSTGRIGTEYNLTATPGTYATSITGGTTLAWNVMLFRAAYDPQNIKTTGDLLNRIAARSTPNVTYSAVVSTTVVGAYDLLKNGTRVLSFLLCPVASNPYSASGSDANLTGASVQLWGPDGSGRRSDAVSWLQSLN